MCGITGAFDLEGSISLETVTVANRAQHARGPDHQVIVDEPPFLLGNTRLAIQDPTPSANQPFHDPNGRFTVVFNGEIYNFRELVRQHHLEVRTGCDGEIIPLLWEMLGPRCLRLFRGMFAIAVADHHRQRLYLARDAFGIKPLYWRRYRGGVLFASDPTPLWRVDRALPLDRRALGDFLQFGAVAAARSPYAGIEAVSPGACLSFFVDGSVRTEFTAAAFGPKSITDEAAMEGDRPLATAFRSSVRLHLLADVPTALLLSAGVDSTLLALAARDEGQSLHCLTVSSSWANDESPQAKATAAEYGHSHETVTAELDDETVNEFLSVMPRPSIDGLNSFLINRAVSAAGYKVALSGLGGDEALGGYAYTRLARALPLLRLTDLVPGATVVPLSWLARSGLHTGLGKHERLVAPGGPRALASLVQLQRELFSAGQVRSMLGRSVALDEETPVAGRGASALAEAEAIRYLQPMLLPDADAFSMASSVELRVPFVDGPFFATALRRHRLRGKPELVRQMGDRYLKLLSRRPKTGFSVPMREWVRTGPLHQVVADASRPDAPIWDYVEPVVGRRLLARAAEHPRWSEPWALAALDGWLRRR